jgi:peptidoglycan/LPS O-acetylase OafA/YrhL
VTASAVLDGSEVARVERTFPALDGLRALAATAVVTTHVAFWTARYTPDLLGRALARLDVGVAVFFTLSGFLLSRPLFLAGVGGHPLPRPAAYLWRRALRVLPAYWLTVTAAFLVLPGNRGAGPSQWIRQLTLTQTYGTAPFGEGLSHTWSLSTEVAFYLALPVIGAGLVRLSRRRPARPLPVLAALAVATVLGLGWIAWTASAPSAVPLNLWLPAFAGWFGAGMALAALTTSDPTWWAVRMLHDLGSSPATCWAGAAALFWIATSSVAGAEGLALPTIGQAVTKNALYLGIATLLLLPLVFGDQSRGRTRKVLSSPQARFLGEISYGIFLLHVVVLTWAYHALGLRPFSGNIVLVLLGTWLSAAGLATVVYLLVERPLRRWRGIVADRPARRAGSSTVATTEVSATSASV